MKSSFMGKSRVAVLCACVAFAGQGAYGQEKSAAELLGNIPRGERVRMDALYLLDYSEKMLQGMNMLYPHQQRIDEAREQIIIADTAELEAIPLELSSGIRSAGLAMTQYQWSLDKAAEKHAQARKNAGTQANLAQMLLGDSAEILGAFQIVDLQWPPSESVPGPTGLGGDGVPWFAEFDMSFLGNLLVTSGVLLFCESGFLDLFGLSEECDAIVPEYADSFEAAGSCAYPGIPYSSENSGSIVDYLGNTVPDRITTLNLKLTTEGIKDAAEQVCGLTVAGFNLSAFCIITDITWIVAESVEQHQELCNDTIGAYELSATFNGVDAINSNVEVMYNTLTVHDEAIAEQLDTHDDELKAVVGAHDEDIKGLLQATLDNQATIIELLKTPQGKRPGWND